MSVAEYQKKSAKDAKKQEKLRKKAAKQQAKAQKKTNKAQAKQLKKDRKANEKANRKLHAAAWAIEPFRISVSALVDDALVENCDWREMSFNLSEMNRA